MKGKMNKPLMTLIDLGENIFVVAITGGPCGGKSTGLAILMSKLSDRGYKVLVSPESATKLMTAGALPGSGELEGMEFQEEILRDTIEQEQRFFSIAKKYRDKGRKVVVLCDRGTMDGGAYVEPEEFKRLLGSLGYTRRTLCDERYHAVLHLQTAAIGAEKFYTLKNNETRKETLEEARALDPRTQEAWQRHPHPRVIDNSTDFEGKMKRLFAEVCVILGDPVPSEKEDKFLVDPTCPLSIPVTHTESRITQDYLTPCDPREEERVRKRTDADGSTYYYTRKRYIAPGNRVEVERMITELEYRELLERKDPRLHVIHKRRICFFWKHRHFELDIFDAPDQAKSLILLETEYADQIETPELPPFVRVIRKVTDEKRYTNAVIAENRKRD